MEISHFITKKNLLKIFAKPTRVLPTIQFIVSSYFQKLSKEFYNFQNRRNLREYIDTYIDVKFKVPSSAEQLQIIKNTQNSLLHLNSQYSNFPFKIDQKYQNIQFCCDVECNRLGNLFTKYGSDKSTKHNYHYLYSDLLKYKRDSFITLLEVGLGTNNLKFGANMGRNGRPGASLKAFAEYLPNAKIFGADVDKKILFQEGRISTFFIDQLDMNILKNVQNNLSQVKFDLIIDDGLHTSEANFNTIIFSLELLKDDGVLVIEDISENDIFFYCMLNLVLSGKYNLKFYKFQVAFVCVISKII